MFIIGYVLVVSTAGTGYSGCYGDCSCQGDSRCHGYHSDRGYHGTANCKQSVIDLIINI